MPDLTQAKEAAERRIKSDYRDTLGELPSLTVELALVSILRYPADYLDELLEKPNWDETDSGLWADWESVFGRYSVRKHTSCVHWWWQFDRGDLFRAETKDEAKSACWADYKARMAGAFKKG